MALTASSHSDFMMSNYDIHPEANFENMAAVPSAPPRTHSSMSISNEGKVETMTMTLPASSHDIEHQPHENAEGAFSHGLQKDPLPPRDAQTLDSSILLSFNHSFTMTNTDAQPEESVEINASQSVPKRPCLSRNDQKWDSYKQEIHQVYIVNNSTLQETMDFLEARHNFQASPRKWKMKLKEWNFVKHLTAKEMAIIVAKKDKRARELNKDTVFLHHGSRISRKKIEKLKRRRAPENAEDAPQCAILTPPSITYFTPLPEEDDLAESKDMSKISGQIRNLQISAPASSSLSSGVVTDGIALGPELPQPQSIAESVVSMPRDKTPEHESAQPTTESSRIKTVIDSEVSQGASSSNRTSLCTGPAESILGDDHFADPSDSTLSDDAFMLMIEEEESLEQQSDITYSKAFDLERRAVFEARGSWVKSTRANKDAIDKYILLEGHDSRNACCIRVDLARAFSQQGRHEESIIMLRLLVMDLALLLQVNPNYENIAIARRVMASCQKMLSSFWPQKTDISLRIAVLIGGAFITRGEIEGAIHFLRDTIDVYQDLGLHDIQSRIKLAFARMLKDRGHIREALKLPQDIFISQLISGLEGRPPTRDIADILVSLRTLYASFVESEYWAGVTQVLSKMVETATSSPEWGLEPFPKLLYQAMNLAGRFSALGERKHAESVFSVGLAKLEGQSTIMVAAWKAATCHWYANHMRREGDVLKTAFYLAKTIQILVRINRHRGRLAAQARTELTKALASAKTLGLNRSLKFAPIYVMIRQSEEAIANGNRRSVATTCDLTEEWDDALSLNTVSTKSIRYGTTCSETDFLGYDIEEFRRP